MKKKVKTPTPTIDDKGGSEIKKTSSNRKNTTPSTRNAERQRSGNNDPQRGSH